MDTRGPRERGGRCGRLLIYPYFLPLYFVIQQRQNSYASGIKRKKLKTQERVTRRKGKIEVLDLEGGRNRGPERRGEPEKWVGVGRTQSGTERKEQITLKKI